MHDVCEHLDVIRALKFFSFTNPVSTTYLMPGIVIEVSAMLVEITTFLKPSGRGLNTSICRSYTKLDYRGMAFRIKLSLEIEVDIFVIRSTQLSISFWPVRNTKISPAWLIYLR